jgi:outer membrane protein
MIPIRFRLSQIAIFGLSLSQALGLCAIAPNALAQSANGTKPSLPTPVSAQSLLGLDMPPQMALTPKQAIPTSVAPSNLNTNNGANVEQAADLIRLYQDAAFSDPVLNAARFNYQASKELFWQGLSLLLPQANAVPGGTRYFQHTAGNQPANAYSGSRVYDQKN